MVSILVFSDIVACIHFYIIQCMICMLLCRVIHRIPSHAIQLGSLLFQLMHYMAVRTSASMINRLSTNVLDFMKMDGLKVHMASCFCGCLLETDIHSIAHLPG